MKQNKKTCLKNREVRELNFKKKKLKFVGKKRVTP